MTRHGRRGGAAIEFAFVLPILILVVTGVVEWGRYINQELVVLHAVREGARMGSAMSDTTLEDETETAAMLALSEERVRAVLADGGVESEASATVTTSVVEEDGLQLIRVEVEVGYTPLVGLVPAPESLRGDFAMMLERG